jgi:phosphopantetheinyl transferase
MEAALCVAYRQVPANRGAAAGPAPGTTPAYANGATRPWLEDPRVPRRAAVTWGAGEAARPLLQVEEVPAGSVVASRPFEDLLPWAAEIVLVDALDRDHLATRVERLLCAVEDRRASDLPRLAATLAARHRRDRPLRLAITCTDLPDLRAALTDVAEALARGPTEPVRRDGVYLREQPTTAAGKLVLLLSGVDPEVIGPVLARHLRDWCLHFPEARAAFDLAERRGVPRDPVPTSELFFPPDHLPARCARRLTDRLGLPQVGAPGNPGRERGVSLASYALLVANQVAWEVFRALGMDPDLFWGQSIGEASAMVASGAVAFEDIARAYLTAPAVAHGFSGVGRLMLVSGEVGPLEDLLAAHPGVELAIDILPDYRFLGGDTAALESLADHLAPSGAVVQRLPYAAVHTSLFAPVRETARALLEATVVGPVRRPVYSSQSAAPYPAGAAAVRDRLASILDHPVQAWQTARRLREQEGARTFVQMKQSLAWWERALPADPGLHFLALTDEQGDPTAHLCRLCGQLLEAGYEPDVGVLYRYRRLEPLDLDLAEDPLPPAPARMPYVGAVSAFEPERVLRTRHRLRLEEDLHLRDHLLARASSVKPPVGCRPTLPMAMEMEAMAEAAACLAPGLGLVALRTVRATRWVTVDRPEGTDLTLDARVVRDDPRQRRREVRVELRSGGATAPAAEAIAVFDCRYRRTLEMAYAPLQGAGPPPFDPERVYEERWLFHGPRYRAVSGLRLLGDNGLVGELRVLPSRRLFASVPRAVLLTDPQVLDGVSQLLALWAAARGLDALPVGVDHVELYRPPPPAGRRLPLYARITEQGLKTLRADVEVQDGEGRVWLRAQGWTLWVFRWGAGLSRLTRFPERAHASREVAPLAQGLVATRLDRASLNDFSPDLLAACYLSLEETARHQAMPGDAPRTLGWLLGRVAAKDAVRLWLARHAGRAELHPAAITIGNDEDGRPFVVPGPDLPQPPRISISHKGEGAVAIAGAQPVGIDIETVETRDAGFASLAFTPAERALLARAATADRALQATRLWASKEAAGKAAGKGVLAGPPRVEVRELAEDGTATVAVGSARARVTTLVEDGLVIAVGLGPAEAGTGP